jgi:hypothetical protein
LKQEEPLLGASVWLRPALVDVRDGFLRWQDLEPDDDTKRLDQVWTARDEGRILDDFLRTDSDDDEVEAFVRRWGVPDLCEHGLPLVHAGRPSYLPCAYAQAPVLNAAANGPSSEHVIRLDHLRTAVAAVRAARRIGKALRSGGSRATLQQEWSPVASWLGFDPWTGPAIADQKQALASAVNRLLQWSASGPRLTWQPNDGAPRLRTHVDGALGAVLLRLASDVAGAGAHSTITCHYCHEDYSPQKLPKIGQRPCCGKPQCVRSKNALNQKSRRAKPQEGSPR